MTLYYGQLKRKDQTFYIVATDEGLCYIGSKNAKLDEVSRWAKKTYPELTLVEDWKKVERYANELNKYMDGKKETFEMGIVLNGTDFQQVVWKALQAIPYGETRSYSDIAKIIDNEKAVRAVGSAIGANPLPIVVPCHRVIRKNGKLSGYRGGVEMKKDLLTIEGINLQ